jgi:hypothetical protein
VPVIAAAAQRRLNPRDAVDAERAHLRRSHYRNSASKLRSLEACRSGAVVFSLLTIVSYATAGRQRSGMRSREERGCMPHVLCGGRPRPLPKVALS